MLLTKNERFQADVKRYTEGIERLTNDQAKLEAKKLLNDLIYEVQNMDNMYMDMVYSKQLPSLGNDMKEKITSLRKALDSHLRR